MIEKNIENAKKIITEKQKNYMKALKDIPSTIRTEYAIAKLIDKDENKCKEIKVPVYKGYHIEGYPNNIDTILSDDGFGRNEHIKTTKNIIW